MIRHRRNRQGAVASAVAGLQMHKKAFISMNSRLPGPNFNLGGEIMQPIYNRLGETVAWRDGDEVLDVRGRMVGIVAFDGFYDMQGHFLGHVFRGNFIDATGRTVAFTNDSLGGPVKPRPAFTATPPQLREHRRGPATALSPQVPLLSLAWSRIGWQTFLHSGEAPDVAAA